MKTFNKIKIKLLKIKLIIFLLFSIFSIRNANNDFKKLINSDKQKLNTNYTLATFESKLPFTSTLESIRFFVKKNLSINSYKYLEDYYNYITIIENKSDYINGYKTFYKNNYFEDKDKNLLKYLQREIGELEKISNTKSLLKSSDNDYLKYSIDFNSLCDSYINDISSCKELVSKTLLFLYSNTNISLFYDYILNNPLCLSEISLNNTEKLLQIIGFSGKTLQDWGLEEECNLFDNEYYFIKMYTNNTNLFGDQDISTMNKFLNFTKFDLGICFFKNCSDFVLHFANETYNKPFFDYLRKVGFNKIQISDPNKKSSKTFNFFSPFFICFITFLSIKLICSVIYIFLKKKISDPNNPNYDSDRYSLNTLNNIDENKSEYSVNDYLNQKNIFDKNTNLRRSGISQPLLDRNYKNRIYKFLKMTLNNICEFFSLQKNYEYIINAKSKFYDESELEGVNLVKLIIIFFFTFNHVFYTSIKLPQRDSFNKSLFDSYLFGIYKLTTYSLDCYVIMEALTTAFKLMKYVKLKGSSLKTFLKFYSFCIPKLFLFFVIYFKFHIDFEDLKMFLESNAIFEKFLIDKYKSKECFKSDPYIIFDYFHFCYEDYSQIESIHFSKCFKFVYVCINMFLSYNIFLIIFYLSLKIKRRIFDLIITSVLFIFLISIFYYFHLDDGNYDYDFNHVLNELLSFKLIHLFLVKYFCGILMGLFWFYNSESTLNDSFINEDNHLPFEFVYKFLIFLSIKKKDFNDNKKFSASKIFYFINKRAYRRTIFFISSMFFILFLIYYFHIKIFLLRSPSIIIPFSVDLRLVYYFERYLFGFAFIIALCCLKVMSRQNILYNAFSKSRLFILYGRINFGFFCMNDTVVYSFFTLYNIQFYFNYQNIFFMTLGLVTINFCFTFLIISLFEQPIRIFTKIINRKIN